MTSLETLFRAFTEYKKTTILDAETARFKKSNGTSGGKNKEDIVVYFSTCTIEEDWVEAIEKGIPFIQKAIAEERQFIRNDGEVLPIEKIRKTTVSSIQDLAKHSNYITHEPDPNAVASVIPDKMLMIQKESDFAVYENRVIYTTLVYLRDFVSKRLAMIKEMTNKYESNSFYKRRIDFGNRKMDINFNLHEERLNDENFINRNSAKAIIDRLDDILSNILVLLKTPLMLTVAKADLVKRPITKTNVLKMNRNFRESLVCFDFIANYQGDGFTVQRVEKSLSPFKPQILGDMSELVLLQSFITYMYGMGMESELEKAYQEILKQEKLEKENEILKRLKTIHSKAGMDEMTINEYLIAFEEGYRIIEKRLSEVDEYIKELKLTHKKEIEDLKKAQEIELAAIKEECAQKIEEIQLECENKIDQLIADYEKKLVETADHYTAYINKLREEHTQNIAAIKAEYEEQITTIKSDYDYKIETLTTDYENQIDTLRINDENQIDELTNNYENRISSLTSRYDNEISSLNTDHEKAMTDTRNSYSERISSLTTELTGKYDSLKDNTDSAISDLSSEANRLNDENNRLTTENAAYEAEIIALKRQLNRNSVKPNEFVTKDDFIKLEKDREAFLTFFDAAWKEAKKYIKRSYINKETIMAEGASKKEEVVENVVKPTTIEVSREAIEKAKQEKKDNKFLSFMTNRFTIFGILLGLIVTSIFFLFMIDESSYLRPEALNNSGFQNLAKLYGLEKFNVHSGSYFILFIICAVALVAGVVAFLKKPVQEKYEYNYAVKKDTDSIPVKIVVKFLTIFYGAAAAVGIIGFTIFFIIYPYETMNWSDAAEPLKNVFRSLGLFFGSLIVMVGSVVLLVIAANFAIKFIKKKIAEFKAKQSSREETNEESTEEESTEEESSDEVASLEENNEDVAEPEAENSLESEESNQVEEKPSEEREDN